MALSDDLRERVVGAVVEIERKCEDNMKRSTESIIVAKELGKSASGGEGYFTLATDGSYGADSGPSRGHR
jgi:hypothetical protein